MKKPLAAAAVRTVCRALLHHRGVITNHRVKEVQKTLKEIRNINVNEQEERWNATAIGQDLIEKVNQGNHVAHTVLDHAIIYLRDATDTLHKFKEETQETQAQESKRRKLAVHDPPMSMDDVANLLAHTKTKLHTRPKQKQTE